ncbi:MAG: hypothetical protein K2O89_00920 [Clostridia bacterium]|nr:hypothetical protein [Clostridia bacterium]
MKKIKSLLLVCMAALMMLVIPLAAACNTDEFSGLTLETITLNLDNVKMAYYLGESFTSEGLEVTGTFKNKDGGTETKSVTDRVSVDSSAFKNNELGRYTINVNCTIDSVTKSSSYVVGVVNNDLDLREGLYATHSDGTRVKTININANTPTATITPTDVIVKSVEFGQVGSVINDYDLKVYKEAEEISSYTDLGSGTYQIWVSKESKMKPGYLLEDFVLIYVVENVSGFKWVGGETSQNIGIDVISKTWTYQITHATSPNDPVILTAADVSISPLEVLEAGSNKYAEVKYVYYKANGERVELTTRVKYDVTKGENQTIERRAYSYADITGHVENDVLTQEDFTGANAFLTKLPAGIVTYRDANTDSGIIQIRGEALRVTFKGVGTLAISARSTGSANLSSIGVKKANSTDKYLTGIYTSTDVQLLEYVEGPMYQVTGNFSLITFTISEPGDYIIFTLDNNPEGDAIFNRDTRVNSIVVNDVFDTTSTASISYDNAAVRSVGKIDSINLYNDGSKD